MIEEVLPRKRNRQEQRVSQRDSGEDYSSDDRPVRKRQRMCEIEEYESMNMDEDEEID